MSKKPLHQDPTASKCLTTCKISHVVMFLGMRLSLSLSRSVSLSLSRSRGPFSDRYLAIGCINCCRFVDPAVILRLGRGFFAPVFCFPLSSALLALCGFRSLCPRVFVI